MNAWIAIVSVLAVLLASISLLRWYQISQKPHPEIVRKLLHVTMGSVTITFPWVFHETWPVWLLALVSACTLGAIKYQPRLKESVGSVVCAVERRTYGEICFPLAVAILFSVAHTQPLLYCVPMAILSIADASSALVGMFYGKHKYSTSEGNKTAEGSLTFFAIASLATLVPLLAMGVGIERAALISLLLGCLVTLFEAIAWQGLDNLFIPLSAYAMLLTGLTTSIGMLAEQLGVACLLLLVAILLRGRTKLNDSAALGAALFSYLSWAIGGWMWSIAPLTVLAAHRLILPAKYRRQDARPHTIHEVIWVASVGFFWLWLSKTTAQSFLLPYTLTYAAQLALIGCAHATMPQAQSLKTNAAVQSCFVAWSALFLPFALTTGFSPEAAALSFCSLLAMLICAAAFLALHRGEANQFHSVTRWAQQTGVVAACSAAVFVILQLT